jgi:hypothetical protein
VDLSRRRELLKPLLPNPHERIPVKCVAGSQRGAIRGVAPHVSGHEVDRRQLQPTQKFTEKQSRHAAIEIRKRVNREQTAFSEGLRSPRVVWT